MCNKGELKYKATEIVKQKLIADHAKIYDMQKKEDLDLLYYYIRDETNKKKRQMEQMISTSRFIAIVKQNRDTGYEFSNKFCAYKIQFPKDNNNINFNDVQIIIPAIALTL